jgi:nitrogen regulatory protein PII
LSGKPRVSAGKKATWIVIRAANSAFLPKVEITITVEDSQLEEVTEIILKASRTGRIGDGKVFQISLQQEEHLEF